MSTVRPPNPELLTATGDHLERLLRPVVQDAFEIVQPIAAERDPKYTGGVFCMFSEYTHPLHGGVNPLAQFPLGQLEAADGLSAAERWVCYTRNSWTKNTLLGTRLDKIASQQLANPNHEIPICRTYQGGVRAIKDAVRRLLSFSGFPADLDEMLVAIVARRIGIYSFAQQMALIEATQNKEYEAWLAAA